MSASQPFAGADRIGFLLTLCFDLTIHARALAYEEPPERAFARLRAFNEMQHQLTQHLGHALAGTPEDKRYPDDVLVAVLRDFAAQAEWDGLDDAIQQALTRNPA